MKFSCPAPLHTTRSPSENSSVISRLCVATRRPAAPGAPCSVVPAAPSRCPLPLWVLHGAGGDAVPVRTTPRCLPHAVLSLRGRSCVLRRWCWRGTELALGFTPPLWVHTQPSPSCGIHATDRGWQGTAGASGLPHRRARGVRGRPVGPIPVPVPFCQRVWDWVWDWAWVWVWVLYLHRRRRVPTGEREPIRQRAGVSAEAAARGRLRALHLHNSNSRPRSAPRHPAPTRPLFLGSPHFPSPAPQGRSTPCLQPGSARAPLRPLRARGGQARAAEGFWGEKGGFRGSRARRRRGATRAR